MPATRVSYLFSLEQIGIKLGLEQIRALVERLGRPDRAYRTVVIAGTNGKGSVTAMVERGLRAAGWRTGRYISPHLRELTERFAIDGRPIDEGTLERLAGRVRDAAATLPAPPTFFEATTAIAFEAFREAAVDVAVLEVGLGGRLDATNVVDPVAVAITSIGFDHEQHLGDTLEKIAREKAGIIKTGVAAVLGANPAPVVDVVRAACAARSAMLVEASAGVEVSARLVDGRTRVRLRTPVRDYGELTLGLRGRHQVDNAIVAVRLLETLAAQNGPGVPATAVAAGLTDVEWPARLELVPWRGGQVLIDGAHNPAGAEALASYVREVWPRPLPFVFGAMRDKKIPLMMAALAPVASHVICTAPPTPRAATPEELAAVARDAAPALSVRAIGDPAAAIEAARDLGDPVVVAGSLYLAGAIRSTLR